MRKHRVALLFPNVFFPDKTHMESKPLDGERATWTASPSVIHHLSATLLQARSPQPLASEPRGIIRNSMCSTTMATKGGGNSTLCVSASCTHYFIVVKTTLRSTYSYLNLTDIWRWSHKAFPQTRAADQWAGPWFGKLIVIWQLKVWWIKGTFLKSSALNHTKQGMDVFLLLKIVPWK